MTEEWTEAILTPFWPIFFHFCQILFCFVGYANILELLFDWLNEKRRYLCNL